MTRKSDNGNPAATGRALASLKNLRTQIDKLDLQILKLVNERARLASEIGRVKFENGGDEQTLIFCCMRRSGSDWTLENISAFINIDEDPESPLDDTIDDILRNRYC